MERLFESIEAFLRKQIKNDPGGNAQELLEDFLNFHVDVRSFQCCVLRSLAALHGAWLAMDQIFVENEPTPEQRIVFLRHFETAMASLRSVRSALINSELHEVPF